MLLFVAFHCKFFFVSIDTATFLQVVLDQKGLKNSSCCLVRDGVLVAARDDALYDYTLETRAGCTAYEGRKQQLGQLRRYLVLVRRASES